MTSGCFIFGLIGAIILSFVGFIVPVRSTTESAQPIPEVITAVAIVTVTPEPACAWNWATQTLPELTDEVQSALDEAGMSAEVTVTAFGENCLNPDGTVRNFATMQTEFDVAVEAVTDSTIQDALRVLALFPVDETPGPQAGYVTIRFTASGQRLRFLYNQGMEALNDNLTGDALLQALGGLQ